MVPTKPDCIGLVLFTWN